MYEVPKILVADDHPAMRHLLRSALSMAGYEVVLVEELLSRIAGHLRGVRLGEAAA